MTLASDNISAILPQGIANGINAAFGELPVRNLKAGLASDPIILILLKIGKVTPYVALVHTSMSRLVPCSVFPN